MSVGKYRVVRTRLGYSIVDSNNWEVRVDRFYRSHTLQELVRRVQRMVSEGKELDNSETSDALVDSIVQTYAVFDTPEEFLYDYPELFI